MGGGGGVEINICAFIWILFDQRQFLDKRDVTLSVVFRFRGSGGGWGRGRNQYLCIDLDIVRSATVFGQEGCHFECCVSI